MYRIFGSVILLTALFVLIAQTDTFRDWMKEIVISVANNQLEGKIFCDEVKLNIFKGIVLVHPRVYADRTLLLEAKELSVTYTLSALWQRIIAIDNVELVEPTIRLYKSGPRGWNFSHLLKPNPDTTKSTLPEGVLVVRSLNIVGGNLFVNDLSEEWPNNTSFDPTHLTLTDVDLNASVRVNLMDSDFALMINNFSMKDATDRLNVDRLSAIVRANKRGVELQSVQLANSRNAINFSASITGVNVFEEFSDSLFATHPIVAEIEAEKVSGEDLQYFIPDVKLRESYALSCTAQFDGKNIFVDKMELKAGNNRVYGTVLVTSVDDDSKLGIDIHVIHSTASYADVRRRIGIVQLPVLNFLTTTSLDSVHLKGHPADSLWFEVHGREAAGEVHGEMTLYLSKPELGYRVNMAIAHGQVGVFNSDSSFATELNGKVLMEGTGLDLATIRCDLKIDLEPSVINGRSIRQAKVYLTANGKGLISFDTVYANITPVPQLDDSLFVPDQQTISLSGSLDVSDESFPRLKGDAAVQAINLAQLTRTESMPRRLTGKFKWDVVGYDLDSIIGKLDADVREFTLRDRAMLPFKLAATSERSAGQRTIGFDSDFGRLKLRGEFLPSQLGSDIEAVVETISSVVQKRVRYFTDEKFQPSLMRSKISNFDMTIDADIKDISPVNMFLSDINLSADFRLRSQIVFDNGRLLVRVDTLVSGDIAITSPDVALQTDPITMGGRFMVSDIYNSSLAPEIEFYGRCDSVVMVNSILLKNPFVEISEQSNGLQFNARSSVEKQWFTIAGNCKFDDDQATVQIDAAHIVIDSVGGLEWKTIKSGTVSISSGRFNVNGISVQRPWAETIHLDGMFSLRDFSGATVRVENFSLKKIPQFVRLSSDDPIRLVTGLVNTCTLVANGTWKEPKFNLSMTAQDVGYNGQAIGNMSLSLVHEDKNVNGVMWISNSKDSTAVNTLDMAVKSLPLNLAIESVPKRLVDGKPIDIELSANRLTLAAIEPFLPAVENVRGYTNAKIWVRGTTPDDIKLGGAADVNSASFTASATNISYLTAGKLHLDGSNLFVDSLVVKNLADDLKNGSALATGVVVFDGLRVDRIDISMNTTSKSGIRVMNMASQTRSPEIFGDLIIRSGRKPIRLFGKIDDPSMEGDIHIMYSDIVFPKERSSTKARYNSFEYFRHSDTNTSNRIIRDYKGIKEVRTETAKDTVSDQVSTAIRSVFKAPTGSFIDILKFNLDIYLEGRVLLTMILGTFEILIADLEQTDRRMPLTFTGKFGDNSTNLRGQVRVREGASSYKFYKPFSTSGILTFNSGGMTNPALDLKAVYENSRYIGDVKEFYKVELTITGTKKTPNISYRLWRNSREVIGDSTRIAGDALMLILVGRTQDELTAAGQGNFVNEVYASFSALTTSALGDMISGNGVFQSAQIDVAADPSQSKLTVIGQVFGNVSYRVSGQISDFAGNSTFTVTVPFSILNDSEALRYFLIDFSRSLNQSGNITRQSRDWEIKLGARLP
ncbi:MAG: hypothetical protein HQ472_01175 [Ignavibacteria bacterium]|nr:hypothetical protein [Ignavibacteria bacterium]